MSRPLLPGLIVLHGNRLELLRDAVAEWLARAPGAPLDEEVFVVQSNATAEWLKLSMAAGSGICAATRFELPARFLQRTRHATLGREALAAAAFERDALTWRFMRLLPRMAERPAFAAVARYLEGRGPERRLQLANRLGDLFDQYQVYRADWLAAWRSGRAVLIDGDGRERPLPEAARWQAELWRAVLAEVSPEARGATRADVHRATLAALAGSDGTVRPLPPRVVVFGAAHLTVQMLETLAALSSRIQVVCGVPDPCRFHWADIVDGRELARTAKQRLPSKGGVPLSTVPLEAMHAHANPLLAAWGRQGRDFMRLLDAIDDAERTRDRFDLARIDLYDEGPGSTMLGRVQAGIRDLEPAPRVPEPAPPDDGSFRFRVAHGVQREVEILHDELLTLFADGGTKPRDVVVMVPDIEVFAPSVRAVFGQYAKDDPRFVPHDIADLKSRGSDPLVTALDWLLAVGDARIGLGDVRDLLEVPAVARRSALDGAVVPRLFAWLDGAGVRWGLDAAHREALGLGAVGDANSWRFGLDRMLLGYAAGDAGATFASVAPFDEVGGLDSAAVGDLVAFVDRIDAWRTVARSRLAPAAWGDRARELLAGFFAATDDRERLTLAALHGALADWLEACDAAAFDEPVPLAVVRDAWLSRLEGLSAARRFFGGGVTFCTLMPLRSVPFDVVCLLGMNEQDFPRMSGQTDFDLLAEPGQRRAGDRSRRDDDRYLMLEALLSARRILYVGWTGRNARDDTKEPPSVLVAQLRDHLAARWGQAAVDRMTVEHPLQPFSRRYFEGRGVSTWAREWRTAHAEPAAPAVPRPATVAREADPTATLRDLAAFLKNPVRTYLAASLDVRVRDDAAARDDAEPFALSGLDRYALIRALVGDVDDDAADGIDRRLAFAKASGLLPLSAVGDAIAAEAVASARAMRERLDRLCASHPRRIAREPVRRTGAGVDVDDWLPGLRSNGTDTIRLSTHPALLMTKSAVRPAKLRDAWVASLAAAACGIVASTVVVGCDATLTWPPLPREAATAALDDLLAAWRRGIEEPLPFAVETAVAWIAAKKPEQRRGAARLAYDGNRDDARGERDDFALGRVYPDFDALERAGFVAWSERLFGSFVRWAEAASVDGDARSEFGFADEEAA